MISRGFRGDPSTHKIYFLTESSFGFADLFSLLCLFALMGLASYSDQLVWWYQKGFSIMHEVSIVLILSCTHKSISNFFIVSGTHWDYHENFISWYRKTWLNSLNGRTSWSSTFNGLETKNKICWEQKQGFQDVNMIPSFGNW